MAKGKTSNPADAYRKAQRAKELKKNKEARKAVRENQTVKRDTRDLENEIKSLKSRPTLAQADKARLTELESELAYVNKVKEKYVSEHPEARDRVFRTGGDRSRRLPGHEGKGGEEGEKDAAQLYDENGRLRDPTRSIYYDPVYNPFGVPPPGMPYRERTPEPVEEKSEDDEEADSDDEIIMPEGPPPESDAESDDSDDIPLPEGPPPPKLPSSSQAGSMAGAPPPMMRPPLRFTGQGQVPPFFPGVAQPPMPMGAGIGMGMGNGMGAGMAGGQGMGMPQPGFRPRPPRQTVPHNRPPSVQDPLSDAPTQTYQGYRMAKTDAATGLPARPPAVGSGVDRLPAKPGSPAGGGNPSPAPSPAVVPAAATISAAPVLRDLRKEATAFVPRGVKRKANPPPGLGGAGGIGSAGRSGMRVNAAPGAGELDEDGDEVVIRRPDGPGLLGVLKGVLGEGNGAGGKGSKDAAGKGDVGKGAGEDDYQRFLEGLHDLP